MRAREREANMQAFVHSWMAKLMPGVAKAASAASATIEPPPTSIRARQSSVLAPAALVWAEDDGTDVEADDARGCGVGLSVRAGGHALEACKAETDGGEGRDDDYNQGYEHGYCRGAACDDGGRYERYEEGYEEGYDQAGYDAGQLGCDLQDYESDYGGSDPEDPDRYEQWYNNRFCDEPGDSEA